MESTFAPLLAEGDPSQPVVPSTSPVPEEPPTRVLPDAPIPDAPGPDIEFPDPSPSPAPGPMPGITS